MIQPDQRTRQILFLLIACEYKIELVAKLSGRTVEEIQVLQSRFGEVYKSKMKETFNTVRQ